MIFISLLFIFFIASIVAAVLFCLTLYRILRRLPEANQQFPSWFVWMFLVPYLGFIFQCIMQPFGIPNALKKTCANNLEAVRKANELFYFGLAQVIAIIINFLLLLIQANTGLRSAFVILLTIIAVALWIVYWVKIVKFRNKYLT